MTSLSEIIAEIENMKKDINRIESKLKTEELQIKAEAQGSSMFIDQDAVPEDPPLIMENSLKHSIMYFTPRKQKLPCTGESVYNLGKTLNVLKTPEQFDRFLREYLDTESLEKAFEVALLEDS